MLNRAAFPVPAPSIKSAGKNNKFPRRHLDAPQFSLRGARPLLAGGEIHLTLQTQMARSNSPSAACAPTPTLQRRVRRWGNKASAWSSSQKDARQTTDGRTLACRWLPNGQFIKKHVAPSLGTRRKHLRSFNSGSSNILGPSSRTLRGPMLERREAPKVPSGRRPPETWNP